MNTKELPDLIAFLQRYNAWRRGAEYAMPDPYELGMALDKTIAILKQVYRRDYQNRAISLSLYEQSAQLIQQIKMLNQISAIHELVMQSIQEQPELAQDDTIVRYSRALLNALKAELVDYDAALKYCQKIEDYLFYAHRIILCPPTT